MMDDRNYGETQHPFLFEFDPEQMEKIETALRSDLAKQIFGENITSILGMLNKDKETTQLKDSIPTDYQYPNEKTSYFPPAVVPVVTRPYPSCSGKKGVHTFTSEKQCTSDYTLTSEAYGADHSAALTKRKSMLSQACFRNLGKCQNVFC